MISSDVKFARCDLCPHRCVLRDGELGICGVRRSVNGKIVNEVYGKVSVVAIERIEKRPIFHFRSGARLLSIGTVGCNLRCLYCQNYEISRMDVETYRHFAELTVPQVLKLIEKNNLDGVAFTYNEPLTNYEYVVDVGRAVKDAGGIVVVSSNGYIEERYLRMLADVVDAWNIDVKAFDEDTYLRVMGGHLAPVLRSVEILAGLGKHVEVTYLIVPGMNDSSEQLKGFAEWVSKLNVKAVHLPRFYPHYLMKDVGPTPFEKIRDFAILLKSYGVENVHGGWEETFGLWSVEELINSAGAEVGEGGISGE